MKIPYKLCVTHYDVNTGYEIAPSYEFFDAYVDDILLSCFSITEEINSRLSSIRIPVILETFVQKWFQTN